MNCDCKCDYQRGREAAEVEFSGTVFFLGMLAVPAIVGFFCGLYRMLEFFGEKF